MTSINSYRDLRVWQIGMDLAEQVYAFTKTFPYHEMYGLAAQMQRAAVSIPSNIAEGHARRYRKEYLHHLSIAHGSLAELDTQIELAVRLKHLSSEPTLQIGKQLEALARQLHSLRNALASGHKSEGMVAKNSLTPNP
ncbi:MAG: four helix bundle protein [Ardenticatenaceae bacterium]